MPGLPRTCINGVEFQQTVSELRMIAAMKGYYNPNNHKESYYVDIVLESYTDMLTSGIGVFFAGDAPDDVKQGIV